MSQLVLTGNMTAVYSNDSSRCVPISAFNTQTTVSPILDQRHDLIQQARAGQNGYIHTSSPNTGDAAGTTHSPYTPGPPFEYPVSPQNAKIVIPCNDYPGDYGFDIYFGEKTTSAPKSAQYTYSSILNKLFVKMNVSCPIQFKCEVPPPQDCIIKATPVFKRPQHMKDIVTRCPNHKITDNATPNHIPVNHLIRVEMPSGHHTVQYNYGADGRESVSVLYETPQVGTEYSTVLFKFMCLSSCVGGINRRPLMLVFTFENIEGQVLGRRAVEIRICSCPGRDRAQEEKRTMHRDVTATFPGEGKHNARERQSPLTSSGMLGKRKKLTTEGDCEEFILKVRGREKYDIIKRVKEALDLMEYVGPREQELYRIHEKEEGNRLFKQIAAKFLKKEHDIQQQMNNGSNNTMIPGKYVTTSSQGNFGM